MRARGANEVVDLLQAKYCAPAWAFLEQVRNRTGYGGSERYADAVAFSLWPSRGLELHGFEVKVSRSDLVAELRAPTKSTPIQKFCDRWWLVLGDAEIIQPGELPPTWGLMVVQGDKKPRLKSITEAPQLQPDPLSKPFVASVLRNFEQTYVPRRQLSKLEGEIEVRVRDGINERLDKERKRRSGAEDHLQQRVRALEELIEDFQRQTGETLSHWHLGTLVDAVRLVKASNSSLIRTRLSELARLTERIAADVGRGLAQLDAVEQQGASLLAEVG